MVIVESVLKRQLNSDDTRLYEMKIPKETFMTFHMPLVPRDLKFFQKYLCFLLRVIVDSFVISHLLYKAL